MAILQATRTNATHYWEQFELYSLRGSSAPEQRVLKIRRIQEYKPQKIGLIIVKSPKKTSPNAPNTKHHTPQREKPPKPKKTTDETRCRPGVLPKKLPDRSKNSKKTWVSRPWAMALSHCSTPHHLANLIGPGSYHKSFVQATHA